MGRGHSVLKQNPRFILIDCLLMMKKPKFNFGFGIFTIILILINITVFLVTAGYIETDMIPAKGCVEYDSLKYSCYKNQAGAGYFLCPNDIDTGEIKDPIAECRYITEICCVENTSGIMQEYALMPIRVSEKPYVLLTSIFLHSNKAHLIGNMIFLFILGCILESSVGSRKFLLIYFLSGIFAGIFIIFASSLGFMDPGTLVAGSSGAIFGVLTALIIMRPLQMIILFGIVYFVVNLGFIILEVSGEGVSDIAHIGGAFGGIISGLWLKQNKKDNY